MSDTSPPNPSSAMLWFFVLTSVYFPIKYYSGGGKQTDDSRTQGYISATSVKITFWIQICVIS